ncbi:MAG: DNA alkylation repair protein, partial [Thermodesulfobacteria bacterium]|nr:DNA alkylation repair protein [Thermodesulfobacteriota bacterium]
MLRYGIISSAEILGIPKSILRKIAKKIGKNQALAEKLWETEIHEARILATLIAEPEKVSENLMERWIRDVDNWDLCDQCILNLFWKTFLAVKKAK